MKCNRVNREITGTVVAVILLLSAWAVTGTTAQAQGRWHGFHGQGQARVFVGPRVFVPPRHARVFVSPRVFVGPRVYYSPNYPGTYSYYAPYGGAAYSTEQGYRDGFDSGRGDARHGKAYDPENHGHFRDAISA